jgi:hypothetical protein
LGENVGKGLRENKDKIGNSKGRGKETHKKLYKLERNGKNN